MPILPLFTQNLGSGSPPVAGGAYYGPFSALYGLNLQPPFVPPATGPMTYGPFLLYGLNLSTSTPVPPATLPTLIQAVRAYLKAAPSLSAVNEVYRRQNAPGKPYPQVILNPIGEAPMLNSSGISYPAWYDLQVTVATLDEDDVCESLRDAAYRLFTPKAANVPLVFGDGATTNGYQPGRKWELCQMATGRGGATTWLMSFQVRFYVSRMM